MTVTCSTCDHFIPSPETAQSVGLCGKYHAWVEKFKAIGRKPNVQADNQKRREMGGKACYALADRHCLHYENTKAATSGETATRLSSNTGAL